MTTPEPADGHVAYVCTPDHDDSTCMFCVGGLFACTRCGAFEGATPTHCPGEQMSTEQADAVYAGRLDYRNGAWQPGMCCEIMRPIHDREAFLAEHGSRTAGT